MTAFSPRLNCTPKFGALPNDPFKPRLYFRNFRVAGVTPPVSVIYSQFPNNGMLGNDTYGDCVFAANGHIVEQQTFFGQGTEFVVTDAEVLKEYTRVTGFDPNDPSTDNGAVVQDGLNDFRKVGLSGHKIVAFAEVVVTALNDVKNATAEFGTVDIGFDFPASAMTQFDAGKPWDVVANDGGIQGGHCVSVFGYDAKFIYVATWGAIQKMTYAFWAKYVTEAWAVIDQDWVNFVTSVAPTGVDLHSLGAQFAALTGQPNPFPNPTPVPVPVPVPVPTPTPTPVPGPPPFPLIVRIWHWLLRLIGF